MNTNNGLDVCPIPVLGFRECPSNETTVSGTILSGQVYDFSAAAITSFWALGFAFLGNGYPNVVNMQQAFLYSTLQLYPPNLTVINSNTVQFTDYYNTPSGYVQTQWQVVLDHTAKKIYIQNLMTKLPQQTAFRACSEIFVNYWAAKFFTYTEPPNTIYLPF